MLWIQPGRMLLRVQVPGVQRGFIHVVVHFWLAAKAAACWVVAVAPYIAAAYMFTQAAAVC